MPQTPFPHILTYPANNSYHPRGKVVRIVNDEPISDMQIQTTVNVGRDIQYATFRVTKIITQRPARGDWSNWGKHPNYYECEVEEIVDARTGTISTDPNYKLVLENK